MLNGDRWPTGGAKGPVMNSPIAGQVLPPGEGEIQSPGPGTAWPCELLHCQSLRLRLQRGGQRKRGLGAREICAQVHTFFKVLLGFLRGFYLLNLLIFWLSFEQQISMFLNSPCGSELQDTCQIKIICQSSAQATELTDLVIIHTHENTWQTKSCVH
jgi:hypothetical protein